MKLHLIFHFLILLFFTNCSNTHNWRNQDLGEPIYREDNTKPLTSVNPIKGEYGGGRGSHHLVAYTSEYGERTETNEWGTEAIVQNGLVVSIGGNNSEIPRNGMVISGNESSSTWINKNLEVGMEVQLTSDNDLKYSRTENTDVEKARTIFKNALDRINKKELSKQYSQILKETEEEIKSHFSLFLKARSDNNIEEAKSQAKQMLAISTGLYYKSFPPQEGEFKGVWVRLSDKTPEELTKTIQQMADVGINAILPETIYNGYTIYPNGSDLMPQLPQFAGWDPMAVMIEECAKHNIAVIPWTEMFFVGGENSPLVKEKPEWLGLFRHGSHAAELEKGFHYFCPSRPEVHQFLLETLDTLASRYPIDGIQLDYIRYSLSKPWEKGFCYCDYCKDKVKAELGFDIYEITPENSTEWDQWNQFRADNVTRFVKSVSDHFKENYPNIPLSADVFPDSKVSLDEKFQDWKLWVDKGYLDEIYIMSYSTMNEAVQADVELLMKNVKGTRIRPIVGLGPYMGFQPEMLLQQIEIAREAGADGVCLFSYHSLSEEQLKALTWGPFGKGE